MESFVFSTKHWIKQAVLAKNTDQNIIVNWLSFRGEWVHFFYF